MHQAQLEEMRINVSAALRKPQGDKGSLDECRFSTLTPGAEGLGQTCRAERKVLAQTSQEKLAPSDSETQIAANDTLSY